MYKENIFQYGNDTKRNPINFHRLQGYPSTNPILIAVDESSFSFIRRVNGVCLFCVCHPSSYELDFCFRREIWVLYARKEDLNKATQLGRATQYAGADKVFVIQINSKLLKETTYGKC